VSARSPRGRADTARLPAGATPPPMANFPLQHRADTVEASRQDDRVDTIEASNHRIDTIET
jgi:hypothetical protein